MTEPPDGERSTPPTLYRRPGRPSAVSQADVDSAAFALLAAGEKPSVEKVIARTGGSTHTVGPLLEAFWRAMAERARLLQGFEGLPGGLPALAQGFFLATLDEARHLVKTSALHVSREVLDRERRVTERVDALETLERQLLDRLRTPDVQLERIHQTLSALDQQLRETKSDTGRLLDERDKARAEADALRTQLTELRTTLASRRQRQPRKARPAGRKRTRKPARKAPPPPKSRRQSRTATQGPRRASKPGSRKRRRS